MNAKLLVATLATAAAVFATAVALAGCNTAPAGPVTAQTEYDLTVDEDRIRFAEDGLAFRGTVGPYAIYTVTAAAPRLVGPNVRPDRTVGYAMLCGATKFFSSFAGAQVAVMSLRGGASGHDRLVDSEQDPAPNGDCAPPKDVFGNPLPDGGSSDDMGPDAPPSFTGADGGITAVPGDGDGELVVQSLQVHFASAPPVDSTVLIRRVALTGARQHNGSHVIPPICCKGAQCQLAPIQ
jgi:hypothetical protein